MNKNTQATNLVAILPSRSWRSAAMHDRYQRERAVDLEKPHECPLCKSETIQAFMYWRIIANKYPYDAVAKQHDQLIPLRHTDGKDLTEAELVELSQLKQTELNERYSLIAEALPKTKSIPGHFHLHLLVPKIVD